MRRLISSALCFTAIGLAISPALAEQPVLERQWVTDGFTNPEGVAAAPDGTYFISNVAGTAADADGEGWISVMSADGALLTKKWAEGLDAPKGMVVHDGILYVADITTVRRYDIKTSEALPPLPVPGAKFLNDMTVWHGHVLVSDSQSASIYTLTDEGFKIWAQDEEQLGGINGLLGDGDRLLVSTMSTGSLLEVDKDKNWTEIASGMVDADGIGIVPGGYLVSAWRGEIYFVSNDGDVTSLLNTREEGIKQNDLSVFGDLIIVPNWDPSTVSGWKLKF